MNKKTAIILGATGLTGSHLLDELIHDSDFELIKIFSRNTTNVTHPKVKEYLGDLLHIESFKNDFTGDVTFCCIGTTASKTKDKSVYKSIDFGIPVSAANLSKENGISQFLVISSMGANSKSPVFYNKTKGEMEEQVQKSQVEKTIVLRPSLILGNRGEQRIGESIGVAVMNFISPLMIGSLKKYRAINAQSIAMAMIKISKSTIKSQIIESDKIQDWSEK
ncbi:MAG: hypothetical protein ACJATA_002127 [Sphingobacteriales bacterium]|jgi:uncharacterized protein YbjT (DUF2867 family)